MITGELKNKIDGLWEIFWTGGLTNPLDVIEQMTYLMFIHDLDDSDNIKAKECAMLGLPYTSIFQGSVQIGDRTIDGAQLKWSVFRDFPAGKMYSVVQEFVFPFIKGLHGDKNSAYSKYMGDAIFKVPTPLMLDKIVSAMDVIYEQMAHLQSADTRGDVYEYLLSKLATAGVNGQFRTPRHIIRMMVDMMAPRADEIICDPACGTSGFLVAASEYLKANRKQEVLFNQQNKAHYMNSMFHGYDMDRTMLRIGAMNMMTHGVDNPCIEYRDSLSDQNTDRGRYTLILANPPFKGSLDYDIVSADLLRDCFACDLAACKGICCVEGNAGAPLETDEVDTLEEEYPNYKPYMTPEGIRAVEAQGFMVVDEDGDYTTPLVDDAECAYACTEEGITFCAIEKAFREGKTTFRKPISCHLYPIRLMNFSNGTVGLNYHRWSICEPARQCGKRLGIPVYKALREPIIRRFGEEFYKALETAEQLLKNQ